NPGESLRNIKMNFPLFVKPTLGGSSVGAGKADTLDELSSRISEIFRMEDRALVQELITGTEVSCGVFEKKEKGRFIPFALPVTEILPGGEFFDYDSKYKDGGSKEITPARINGELTKKVQESAIVAHTLLGCSGYSRTDFIIRNNIPYILETNTLPGMTATSLIPQQVKNIGLSMETFFDYLIERALQN
ncbi:MAG: ATP-grasp domain-containing protein, partial [Leptospira sp.]|nr:ATP-grasp domain-containing protein [Leptospira sp.]